MQVRDLIDSLKPFPPEQRLAITVECSNGEAAADDVEVRRREDVVELKVTGALVRSFEPAE